MNLDPNQLTAASLDSLASMEAEVTFDVDAAIASNDVSAVWAEANLERIAALPLSTWGRLRSRLLVKFGAALSVKLLDQDIADKRRRLTAPAPHKSSSPLVDIQVNGRAMRDQAEQALIALRATNDPPNLFVRSGEMVFIDTDERQRPKIVAVSPDNLRGRLERCANFIRQSDTASTPTAPPVDVVRDIMAMPCSQWGLPPLDVLVEIPTLRPDGSVVDRKGYDERSKMFYEPDSNLQMLPIPEDPCTDEITDAIGWIDDAIGEFPFVDESSRANFFGLLLTPIIRPAIGGCTPIALIDAPNAGTGKSLLADVFSLITTGRPCSMMPYPRDDQEMQKLIGATLLQGRSVVCFDNVEGVLASPTLALALTAQEYETRILGLSENMTAPNRATWLATGNNIRPSGDMPRRCYHIRIDAESSQPYRGRTFKHEDLRSWVQENRAELLRALLLLARAWFAHGSPRVVTDPLGSFEQWHRTIGGILHGARVVDFLGNLDEMLESGDDQQVQWTAFLCELCDEYRGDTFTARQVADRVRNATPLVPCPFTLPDSLADTDRHKDGGLDRALQRSFAKRAGTRLGPRQVHLVRHYDKKHSAVLWTVAEGAERPPVD